MLAAAIFAVAVLFGGVASAQIGIPARAVPLPSLPQLTGSPTDALEGSIDDSSDALSIDAEDLLPTPLPTESVIDTIDDTTGTIDDTLDAAGGTLDELLGDDDDGATGGGGGEDGDGDGDGGGTGGGDSATGASVTGGTSGPVSAGAGAEASVDGNGTPTAGVHASYGTVATKSVIAAAGRLLHLAGPLAAPLILGGLAMGALMVLGRGSNGLLKIEALKAPTRSFRL